MDMNIRRSLFSDCRHESIFITPGSLIVMAQENPGFPGQRQNLLDRLEQGSGITSREVATRGAVVRHEQGVANKRGITDHVGKARRSMPGGMQYPPFQATDAEGIPFTEELIKLTAITGKLGASVKRFTEDFLHIKDMGSNSGFTPQVFMQIRCRREMVSMNVGFENPLDSQVMAANILYDRVSRTDIGASCGVIEVQNGIDNGTGLAVRIPHYIAEGVGWLIKEMLDDRVAHEITSPGSVP
eukprot:TRINITY_DN5895_c0_g4_i1.p2 TRINITY_DN5895_c0_g4~~TRINITY_DN5895_c0_g4_i1.p2  ORF type:complete len:242 (+),score=2.08 TRINITY_DN5895_c0_g4_i1:471-1196(+)